MVKQAENGQVHAIHLTREVFIAAPIGIAFAAVLEELGPGSEMPDGTSMRMKIEAWPGGRWYRDLGDDNGHLWGHVQVIKAPTLLELTGPMFMSYPAVNHVRYKLTECEGGVNLVLEHRALGHIPQEHRDGVEEGWDHGLKRVREIAMGMLKG